jgi:nucleoside-triphosphatase THEP1
MITIVTGEIDSGKTRYLKEYYDQAQQGDGIISLKHFYNEQCIGYDVLHLKTGEQQAFIRLKNQLPVDWKEQHDIGRFSFSEQGFIFAEKVLNSIECGPVYIDEIGPLEIWYKKGFYNKLKELIKKDMDLFLTLRPTLINEFYDEFNISGKTEIITLK